MRSRSLASLGLAAGLTSGLCAPLAAGPLDPEFLPADAAWIAHINIEALVESSLGQLLLDSQFGVKEAQAKAMEQLGFDPVTELLGLTLYGMNADPEPSVMIVESTSAIDRTIEGLRDPEQRPHGYSIVESEGHIVHVFGNGAEGGDTFATVVEQGRDRIVIVGDSLTRVHAALAIVEGHGANLADADDDGLSLRGYKNALVFVETGEINSGTGFAPASEILQAAEGVSIRVVEEDDDTTLFALTLRTPDEKKARNLSDVLTGVVGMGRMMASQQDELAPIADVLRSIAVRPDRSAISVDMRLHRDMIEAIVSATQPHLDGDDAHQHDGDHGHADDRDEHGDHDDDS